MKKNLSKTLYLLMAFSFVLHMFMPLTVLADDVPTKWVTITWDCSGNLCASELEVPTYTEQGGVRNYYPNRLTPNDVKDGEVEFDASDITSFGKGLGYNARYLIFDGKIKDELQAALPDWETLNVGVQEDTIPHRPIDVCGGNDGPHSVTHNGDREFRLTIFDDGFMPIEFNVDPSRYTYYLGEWDPVFANPVFDLSNDKDNPTVYTTYLLEKRLSFSAVGHQIKSVKALDVSNKGVTINVVDNAVVNITFNSNYFSEVVFEVTFTDGQKGYFKADRKFVDFAQSNRMNPGEEKMIPYAEFTYPEDKTIDDYDVYAKYITDKGEKTVKLTASKVKVLTRDQGVLNDTVFDAGERLKKSYYPLDIDKNTKSVSITVTKKDALVASDVYGGTFGGHGDGVELDISIYKMMLDRRV